MDLALSLNPAGTPSAVLVEAARRAEDAGFTAVYCYDHISGQPLGGSSSHHVWSVLGALAAATSRVSLGPLVANVTTRHPVDLALAAATLQDLAGGRFVLGLGAGASGGTVWAAEMDMFRLPADPAPQRRARLAETIELLRALWRGDDRFEGEWAAFEGVEAVAAPEPVCPIVVGANGPLVAELAGRLADGVNLHFWEHDLGGLIERARGAAGDRPFVVSVEGRFEQPWVDPESPERRTLEALGVNELVLAWSAQVGLDAIDSPPR